jgi:hypothetical protein
VVDTAWVEMVAALPEEDSGEVTSGWIVAVAKAHDMELEVTTDAIQAVASLIRLCKTAKEGSAQVVHLWYL